MKRGTDHTWHLRKYSGDIAIYAKCSCGYEYACSRSKRNPDNTWSFEQEVWLFHNYCPHCGARKKYMGDFVEHIDRGWWDESH